MLHLVFHWGHWIDIWIFYNGKTYNGYLGKMMPSIGPLVLVWQFFGEGEVKSKISASFFWFSPVIPVKLGF